MQVKVKKLHPDAIIPKYQSEGASGFDFHALETVGFFAGETRLVKTGLSFEIPKGYELQVRPRSGTSFKTKFRVANSPGTVDSDYRGEVCIIIDNIEPPSREVELWFIHKGERCAQGVIVPVEQVNFEEATELSESERNNGAFGSTGK